MPTPADFFRSEKLTALEFSQSPPASRKVRAYTLADEDRVSG